MQEYDDRIWYDVMQVCMAGHVITSKAKSHPEAMKQRCPECGAKTITQCIGCNTEIQGYKHIPRFVRPESRTPPRFCHKCGESYPWTAVEGKPNGGSLPAKTASKTNDVFVVHGHDNEMMEAVARVLFQIGLKPIILHERPNSGKTLIEKFEKNAEVQFATVLLSPDDMAFPVSESPDSAKPRARQNVVLELGYFVGRLTRERVFTLKRGDELEIPSDISGIVYTQYDKEGHWRIEFIRELKEAGYDVNANDLFEK